MKISSNSNGIKGMQGKILICCEGSQDRGFGHVMRSSMLALALELKCSWYWVNISESRFPGDSSEISAMIYPIFVRRRIALLGQKSKLTNIDDLSLYDIVVVDGVLSKRLRQIQLRAQQLGKTVVSISPEYKWNNDVDVVINRYPLKSLKRPVMYCGSDYFIPGRDLNVLKQMIRNRTKCVAINAHLVTLVACFGGGERHEYIKTLFGLLKTLPSTLIKNLELIVVDPCNGREYSANTRCMPVEAEKIPPTIKAYYVQGFEDALGKASQGSELVVLCSAGVFAYEVASLGIPFAVIDDEAYLSRLGQLEDNRALIAYGTLDQAKHTIKTLLSSVHETQIASKKEEYIDWAQNIEKVLKVHI